MKTSKLAALGLAAATAAALGNAGSATPARTRTLATDGLVAALSADGSRVAVATTGLAHACDRVVLWNAPARSATRWAAHTNCGGGRQTSGGQRLTEIALAGTRALWVESIAGNNQELALWSATPAHRPSMLALATNGNGAGGDPSGDYLGRVHADGTLAAFNTWTVCPRIGAAIPPICPPGTIAKQTLWRVTPGAKQTIRRAPDATFVVAVDAGRIAVQHPTGNVTIFSASGSPLTQIAVPAGTLSGLALSGTQLAVIRGSALEIYSTGTGALTKRITLPASPAPPRLRDLYAGLAVYTAGRTVHVVKVSTGRNRAWAAPTTAVDAQLEQPGLWYAYNRASGSARGRVVFLPRSAVAARLR